MKFQPLISVIIPIHNTAEYLERCIESVRNQTLKELEIILVDNLSIDKSPVICDEYEKLDFRIRVLHLSIAGPSVARNAGIRIASAPYVGFVDSDDYLESTMYADMLKVLEQKQADMVYCNFCYEYEDNRIEQIYPNSGMSYFRSSTEVLRDIICEQVSSSPCTKLFKKELFDSLLFPEGVFFEDHATVYRWVAECKNIVWIDRAYYHYIQREGSTCHTVDSVKHYHFFLAEYPRLEFIKRMNLFEKEKEYEAVNFIIANCLYRFSEFMKGSQLEKNQYMLQDMRRKLKAWLSMPSSEIEKKNYNRLWKITYIWAIYRRKHYSKK